MLRADASGTKLDCGWAPLTWISPNTAIAKLALAAMIVESALLAGTPDNIYGLGPLMFALVPALLFWIWLTFGWLLWLVGILPAYPARRDSSLHRVLGNVLAFAILLASAVVLVSSWVVYFRTGRFATIEAGLFAVYNLRMISLYMMQTEKTQLLMVGSVLILLTCLLPFVLSWMRNSSGSIECNPSLWRKRRLVWYAAGITWMLLLFLADSPLFPGEMQRNKRHDALKYRLDPFSCLISSIADYLFLERIEPCLNERELRPRFSPGMRFNAVPARAPSVIFVAMESLRADVVLLDHQGREVTPTLNWLAREGLHVRRAYVQSTHSDYSDVSVLSSLYPLRTRRHHYYRRSDPWPKTLIYDVLKEAGYATAIFSSQNEGWGGMDNFLRSGGLDVFWDSTVGDAATRVPWQDTGFANEVRGGALRAGKLDDADTMDAAIAWIHKQAMIDARFFLYIALQNAHFPYEISPAADRPFRPCEIDFSVSFLTYPIDKVDVMRNAYYNALHDSDRQLKRLLDELAALRMMDDVIVVVYGDNGEAFHENGIVTHAQAPIEPCVRVGCVLYGPRYVRKRIEDYPVELVDIAPTVLALMGLPKHPNFQGINFLASERPALEDRAVFILTENALTRSDAVVLAGRWKYVSDRSSGAEYLYDLVRDPNENCDVSRASALTGSLRDLHTRWRKNQLAFYHYPFYFEKYYPPLPPSPR